MIQIPNKLKKYIDIWYGIIGLLSIFIIFFSHDIVSILTHDKFTEAADIFVLWVLIILSMYYGLYYSNFLIAHNKIKEVSVYGTSIGMLSLVITGLLVYSFGMLGAAIGAFLYNISIQIINRYLALKFGCEKYGEKNFIYISLIIFLSLLSYNLISSEYHNIYILLSTVFIFIYYDIYNNALYLIKKKE